MCFLCVVERGTSKERHNKLRKVKKKLKHKYTFWGNRNHVIFNIDLILTEVHSYLDDGILENGFHYSFHRMLLLSSKSIDLFFSNYVKSKLFRTNIFQRYDEDVDRYATVRRQIRVRLDVMPCQICHSYHSYDFYVNYTSTDGHVYGFELDGELCAYRY